MERNEARTAINVARTLREQQARREAEQALEREADIHESRMCEAATDIAAIMKDWDDAETLDRRAMAVALDRVRKTAVEALKCVTVNAHDATLIGCSDCDPEMAAQVDNALRCRIAELEQGLIAAHDELMSGDDPLQGAENARAALGVEGADELEGMRSEE